MTQIDTNKTESIQVSEKSNGFPLLAAIATGIATAYVVMKNRQKRESFRGKTVVITGGSRGLGLVMAREFAKEGAKLAICSRTEEQLLRAKRELEGRGAEIFAAVCDVREQSQVNNFIGEVKRHFGKIDVLINSAGVIQVGPLEVQTEKDFQDAMNIHFWAPFYLMQAVIPDMRERGAGKIVNISSIAGKMATPHLAPYSASKFALVGLSNAMNVELAKDGISVTTVCPGLMRTGSHVNALFKGQNEKEFALFSISNALPFTSVSAEYAAREIVEAVRTGASELIISPQAQLAAKANALFPELVAGVAGLVNQFLPGEGGIGTGYAKGKDSRSFASPSFLTANLDAASIRNNHLKPSESLQ